MRYLSKVCMSARGEAADKLVASEVFSNLATEKHVLMDDGVKYAFVMCESVNWYEHDPEYPNIEEITKIRCDHYDDVNFVRVGEEYDDIEAQIGFWEDPFDVEPSVSIQWQLPPCAQIDSN